MESSEPLADRSVASRVDLQDEGSLDTVHAFDEDALDVSSLLMGEIRQWIECRTDGGKYGVSIVADDPVCQEP